MPGVRTAVRRLLHQFARPVRENEGAEGLVIEPYRGYGDRHDIYLIGRVYRQPGGRARQQDGSGDLRAALKRLLRRGEPGQAVTARFGSAEQRVVTDRDGYFHVRLPLAEPPPADRLWHQVDLAAELPSRRTATAKGEVFIPSSRARYVVISDIDDTVILTGVANKVMMFWRLFAQGVQSRVAFPGVAALYRAFHGDEQNPILYVSRGPWSIYSMLEAFFQRHRIPAGPVLFLREWGIRPHWPLPRRSRDHKLTLIRDMLALYQDLPCVLIGDSGQHDPEIYARVVAENPGRVLAIYIRNVSRGAGRISEIEKLAQEVLDAGSSLLLATDSVAIAEHAAAHGLVSSDTPRVVAGERRAEGATELHPVQTVRRDSREETEQAISQGELERTLKQGGEEPPNTVVESAEDEQRRRQSR